MICLGRRLVVLSLFQIWANDIILNAVNLSRFIEAILQKAIKGT